MRGKKTFIVLAILLIYVVLSVAFALVQSPLIGESADDAPLLQHAFRSLPKGVLTQPVVAVLSASDDYALSINSLRRECAKQSGLFAIIFVTISIAFMIHMAIVFVDQYFSVSVLAYFSGGISPPSVLI